RPSTESFKLTAAEQMQVQVEHRLTTGGVAVEQQSINRLRDSQLGRYGARPKHQRRKYRRIRICYVVHGGNVLFWNNEHVRRRLGVDVVECEHVVVFIDDIARQLARDDP